MFVREGKRETCQFRDYELAALVGFLFIPPASIAIAHATQSFWQYRYGLTGTIGIAGLFAAVAGRGTRLAGWLLVLLLAVAFGWSEASFWATPTPADPLIAMAKDAREDVVFADTMEFMNHSYYADRESADRMHFVLDRAAILRFENQDLDYQLASAYRKWFPLRGRVEPMPEFLNDHSHFLLYCTLDAWIVNSLRERNADLRLLGARGARKVLLRVDLNSDLKILN
jgi:hypothetical protein